MNKYQTRLKNDKKYQAELKAWNERRTKFYKDQEHINCNDQRCFGEPEPCRPCTKEEIDEMNKEVK
jgi:hypothetical protein